MADGKRAIAAAAYVRISDAREGDTAGIDRQQTDCQALAARMGWTVGEVYAENDRSAFKRKKVRLPDGTDAMRVVRPEFRRLLDDITSGGVGALVAYDLDRVARDPRDLEDLIDAIVARKIPTMSVTGNLDLSNSSGILVARMMVAVANKSSDDTGRRVARKHLELAEQGRFGGGGKRSFGYERKGMVVVEAEAAIVREVAERIITGESTYALARDLTARGIPTALGSDTWSHRSVWKMVAKPRVAGLREYRGEIIGVAAWPPILTRQTWKDVRAALSGRARTGDNRLVAWLTGVLLCGHCDTPLVRRHTAPAKDGRRDTHQYACPAAGKGGCGRVGIHQQGAEAAVEGWILDYLDRPDVSEALAAATSADTAKTARAEVAADEALLKELAGQLGRRQMTLAEWAEARRPVEERLRRSRPASRARTPAAVRKLLDADDREQVWGGMGPHDRREVARLVFPHGIRVLPARRGVKFAFDRRRLVPVDGERAHVEQPREGDSK